MMHTMMFLPLLLPLVSGHKNVYDVTTIYRLTVGLEEGAAHKLDDSQKASCLIDSMGCEGWSSQGWTKTDSGLSGVIFPASEPSPDDSDATAARAVAEFLDFSITDSGIDRGRMSFANNAAIYMVFSTGADETASDLLVLRLDGWRGGRVTFFRCLLGRSGSELSLPDGTRRACDEFDQGTFSDDGRSGAQYRVTWTTEKLQLQRISDLQVLCNIIGVNQLEDIKFFRIIAKDGLVQHTEAVPVLSLTSRSGSLYSRQLSHPNSAAICVSFSAFVDHLSCGSITVAAMYDDGQRVPLGRVLAAANDDDRTAKSWEFSALVDPSDQRTFRFEIKADKIGDFPVLITNLSRCTVPERAEAHARTNARRFPFVLRNGVYAEPEVGIWFLGCNSRKVDSCPWQRYNWDRVTGSARKAARDNDSEEDYDEESEERSYVDAEMVFLANVEATTATMKSPAFQTSTKKACVVVDYYTDNSSSTLKVTAQTKDGLMSATAKRTATFQIVHDDVIIQGQKQDTFEVDLPGGWRPHFITLEVSKPINAILWVDKIFGCNAQEDEDVRVFINVSTLQIDEPGFNVAVSNRAVSLTEETCANGGRVAADSLSSCVCPAGFAGENCEKGCGANSYGADCGGRCSATERGCRGMLLCMPLLGCSCGPGLTGPLCDQPCRRGQFGAGCAQGCGHCAGNSTCDIYTGECLDGCRGGYFPPICSDNYKSLTATPTAKMLKSKWMITFDLDDQNGSGNPMFYVVQYRLAGSTWSSLPSRLVTSSAAEAELPALAAGRRYQARVVLVDSDGGSYQADDVPYAQFDTPCEASKATAELASENITETSFVLTWKPPAEVPGECPTTGYQLWIKMGWQWLATKLDSNTTSARLGDDGTSSAPSKVAAKLLPGHAYQVLIRVLSRYGPGPISADKEVTTLESKPFGRVSGLNATVRSATELEISWSRPTNGHASKFRLDYQCELMLACPESNCSESRGSLETSELMATLTGLTPLARYKVTVALLPSMSTRPATLMTSTSGQAPDVAPSMAVHPVAERGNSSLTVQWRPVASCAALHGFATGYVVELWRSPVAALVAEGNATVGHEIATFEGLEPHTNYTVKVFVVTSSGLNADLPLEFTAKTRATTPGPVQALAVYKRGRRTLGLRWAPPHVTHGALRSFTVTHAVRGTPNRPDDDPATRNVIAPTPCVAWPHLFCHTIDKLVPDTEYKVTIQAQNAVVEEDGKEESVLSITKEGTPSAPSDMQLANVTSSELTVQWGVPDLFNGQLRSFLLNVEQTDSANATECCRDFPMREIAFKTEELRYELQMPGLLPASTYLLSLSAKTVALGPSASVTAHTRPSVPEMPTPPGLKAAAPLELVVGVTPAPRHDLLSGQLLLLAASKDSESNDTAALDVFDPWLAAELASINTTLYLAAEFPSMDEDGVLRISPGDDPTRGRFGVIQVPPLVAATLYQLVQVTVFEYCGVLGIGFVRSDTFSLAT